MVSSYVIIRPSDRQSLAICEYIAHNILRNSHYHVRNGIVIPLSHLVYFIDQRIVESTLPYSVKNIKLDIKYSGPVSQLRPTKHKDIYLVTNGETLISAGVGNRLSSTISINKQTAEITATFISYRNHKPLQNTITFPALFLDFIRNRRLDRVAVKVTSKKSVLGRVMDYLGLKRVPYIADGSNKIYLYNLKAAIDLQHTINSILSNSVVFELTDGPRFGYMLATQRSPKSKRL